MAIQDQDSLALAALSILSDPRPHPSQPILGDGIYLRWFPGANRGFPIKGGYYLFRRRAGRVPPTCMRSFLTKTPVESVAKQQLVTPVGTISRSTGDPLPVVPFEPDPSKDKAFALSTTGSLQFDAAARSDCRRPSSALPNGPARGRADGNRHCERVSSGTARFFKAGGGEGPG